MTAIGVAPYIPGYRHVYSGKVRDIYAPDEGSDEQILVVASDRLSAFDHVLQTPIPGKGIVLTQLSLWWFDQLDVPNHVIAGTVSGGVPPEVAGRGMICSKLDMIDVECIVRGYLTGSGYAEYRAQGTLGEEQLPDGLVDGSALPTPVFTPSVKAAVGEHDENISIAELRRRIDPALARHLEEESLSIYSAAEAIARERGIILADTKFEFGFDVDGLLTLGDEVLTPDSSRFWDAAHYKPGGAQPSFDKQPIRDWLASAESGWDAKSGEQPPALPDSIVAETVERYTKAYEQLTGQRLDLESFA